MDFFNKLKANTLFPLVLGVGALVAGFAIENKFDLLDGTPIEAPRVCPGELTEAIPSLESAFEEL